MLAWDHIIQPGNLTPFVEDGDVEHGEELPNSETECVDVESPTHDEGFLDEEAEEEQPLNSDEDEPLYNDEIPDFEPDPNPMEFEGDELVAEDDMVPEDELVAEDDMVAEDELVAVKEEPLDDLIQPGKWITHILNTDRAPWLVEAGPPTKARPSQKKQQVKSQTTPKAAIYWDARDGALMGVQKKMKKVMKMKAPNETHPMGHGSAGSCAGARAAAKGR